MTSKLFDVHMPIMTILYKNQELVEKWMKSYLKFLQWNGLFPKSLDLHKKMLGKQSNALCGKYRYWVWLFPKYTVYVSKVGIEICIDSESTPEEAVNLWNDYTKSIGYEEKEGQ